MVNQNSVLSSISFSQTSDWNIKQFFGLCTIKSNFDFEKLGTAIKRRKDQMTVEDGKKYKRITIKTKCGGVVVRDEVLGEEIKTKNQYYVRTGQLAVSKIDARNGTFGIVPPEADGAIITGNFWVFDVNPELADVNYLILLLSSNVFVRAWMECSNGSGNRLYLQENKFLNYRIPLPNINAQIQIVTKFNEQINCAENEIRRADKLSKEIDEYLINVFGLSTLNRTNTSGTLIVNTRFKSLIGWGAKTNSNPTKPQEIFKTSLFDNMPLAYYCEINPKTTYPIDVNDISFVPMECVSDVYGEISNTRDGNVSSSNGYTSFKEGDVIWAKITPCMQNGKCAVAQKLKNGYGYGSTEFHVFRCNHNAIPEYIYCFLRSERLRNVAMDYFTGSAGQQRVGTDFLEALTIPNLPICSGNPNQLTQEIIVKKVLGIKTSIKALHNEAECIRLRAKKEFEEVIFGE